MLKSQITTSVVKDDSGKLRQVIKKMKGAYVTAGIHQDAGQEQNGADVVKVALWNEFGTEHIPERSFFRSAIDKNIEKINKWREQAINDILSFKNPKSVLDGLGFKLMVLIQNEIKQNIPPSNAPETIKQKAADGVAPNTLIWSGTMLRSITFRSFGV